MEEYLSHADVFLLLTMSHRRFEKILCVGTLLSAKDSHGLSPHEYYILTEY